MTDPVAATRRNAEQLVSDMKQAAHGSDSPHDANLLANGAVMIDTLLTLLAASERRREELLSDRVLETVARSAMGRGSFGLEWDMATPESQRIYLRNARDYLTDALRATLTPGGPDA